MEKIKNVIKNHKKQIIIGSVVVDGAVACVVVMGKFGSDDGVVLTAPEDAGVKAGDVVKITRAKSSTPKVVKAAKPAAA